MSFMDRIKEGIDRVAEEATDFAQTTRLQMEISGLNDRKAMLLQALGQKFYDAHRQGKAVSGTEKDYAELKKIDIDIDAKKAEIARVEREDSRAAPDAGAPATPPGGAAPATPSAAGGPGKAGEPV